MKLIVGLGNPGPKYKETRHNIGFMVLDAFLDGTVHFKSAHTSEYGEKMVGDVRCILQKPMTFMNLSGKAVKPILKKYAMTPKDLIVLHDEVDFPLGKVRVKFGGGAGGHNGVQSIIDHLQTGDFVRLRIGIGRDGQDLTRYVLSRFEPNEREDLQEVLHRAGDMLRMTVVEGYLRAQNRYHG